MFKVMPAGWHDTEDPMIFLTRSRTEVLSHDTEDLAIFRFCSRNDILSHDMEDSVIFLSSFGPDGPLLDTEDVIL